MNVSLQNIDKVSALLTVKLEKADYPVSYTHLDVYKRQLLHWLFARIVVSGMYITLYVVHVVTIEVSLQLKRKLPYNYGQFQKVFSDHLFAAEFHVGKYTNKP